MLTKGRKPKLSAYHHRISAIPGIITDGTPAVMVTELNSSFIIAAASDKTHITIFTHCACSIWCTEEKRMNDVMGEGTEHRRRNGTRIIEKEEERVCVCGKEWQWEGGS